MKVDDIIFNNDNNVNTILENNLDFNNLTSLQIAALRAIYEDRMDIDNASDRMLDVIYNLQDDGLIDKNFNLTSSGKQAVELAHQLGGSRERRRASIKDKIKIDDIYDDDYNNDELEDYESIYRMNKFGSPNQNN